LINFQFNLIYFIKSRFKCFYHWNYRILEALGNCCGLDWQGSSPLQHCWLSYLSCSIESQLR